MGLQLKEPDSTLDELSAMSGIATVHCGDIGSRKRVR